MMARYRRELAVAGAWALLLIFLGVRAPSFFGREPLRALLVNAAPVLIAAVGSTLVILARQIDISIGSQFSVCGIVAGLMAASGWPLPLVALLTVAVGGLLGGLNAVLVSGFRLPAIVVTLSTLVALRESLRYFREGEFVRNLSTGFQWFGLGQTAGQGVILAIAAAVAGLIGWGLANIAGGRMIYATGSDPEAARLVGMRPQSVVFGVFVACGLLTGLASLCHSVRFADVDPNAGNGFEMQVIAAVVLGGTSINGGRGTVLGTVLGVLLMATIGPALVFLHVEPQWERALQGLVILGAVASDALLQVRDKR